jgi:hypothetical protein
MLMSDPSKRCVSYRVNRSKRQVVAGVTRRYEEPVVAYEMILLHRC